MTNWLFFSIIFETDYFSSCISLPYVLHVRYLHYKPAKIQLLFATLLFGLILAFTIISDLISKIQHCAFTNLPFSFKYSVVAVIYHYHYYLAEFSTGC